MRIVVCIKRVPSTETRVVVAPDGKTLDPGNVEYVLNPYDEIAVEEALKLVEANGGEVELVCLGPGNGQKEIRTGLAMGANAAVHLKDEARGRDGWSTARILAEHLQQKPADLILFGRTAVDYDQGQVGPRVATLLGLGCVTCASTLRLEGGRLRIEREIEGGREVVETALPAVVTAQKGLNEPRYPSLKGIMQAKKKPLEERACSDPGPGLEVLSMALPPKRPEGQILGEGPEAVRLLLDKLRNEAKIL